MSGWRGCLGVPMIRDGQVIGAIFVARETARAFCGQSSSLLKTFADQAVVAIENVRLFNETKEALAQQTATADVLKVISRSTFDLQTVLHALIETATRQCDADKEPLPARSARHSFGPQRTAFHRSMRLHARNAGTIGTGLSCWASAGRRSDRSYTRRKGRFRIHLISRIAFGRFSNRPRRSDAARG